MILTYFIIFALLINLRNCFSFDYQICYMIDFGTSITYDSFLHLSIFIRTFVAV